MKFTETINKWSAWTWIVILLTILSTWYWLNMLPAEVITHWGFDGQPNGWSSREFAVWFLPSLMLLMLALFYWLPKLDPRKENYKKFSDTYYLFIFAIILFLAILYFITNLVNLGVKIDITQAVMFMVGALFILLGSLLDKVRSNWFIGVRTPWTLSSENVWKQTHIFAKKVFIISGLVLILSQFLATWLRWQVFWLILVLMLSPIIYSYFLYKKEQ